jgi:hypothetical protein
MQLKQGSGYYDANKTGIGDIMMQMSTKFQSNLGLYRIRQSLDSSRFESVRSSVRWTVGQTADGPPKPSLPSKNSVAVHQSECLDARLWTYDRCLQK